MTRRTTSWPSARRANSPQPQVQAEPTPAAPGAEPVSKLGENADGVRAAAQLLGAATNARWPMYLRNVKQILRAGNLDERRYGFGGLMDLLKACQRDGLVRIERDRRGGLRVFQGQNMARPANAPQPEPEEANGNVADPDAPMAELADDLQPVLMDVTDGSEPDVIEIEPVSVVDTTAELLGRAKPRAPRTRAGRTGQRCRHAGHAGTGPLAQPLGRWREEGRCSQEAGREEGRSAVAQAGQQERRRLREQVGQVGQAGRAGLKQSGLPRLACASRPS